VKRNVIVYDVEINRLLRGKEWGRLDRSLFASAVVYSYSHDRFFFFLHIDSLSRLHDMMDGCVAVSFNGVQFDSKIVIGGKRKVRGIRPTGLHVYNEEVRWLEYDLYLQCLKSAKSIMYDMEALKQFSPGGLKLDDVARGTLNRRKSGSGSNAPGLYQAGHYDKLLEYNYEDVVLTKRLFEHSLQYGRLRGDGVKVNIKAGSFHGEYFQEIL